MNVVIKVSRRSNRVEGVQKRSVLKSPEEKNASLPKRSPEDQSRAGRARFLRKGKVLAEGQAKKFAEGLEERSK